MKRNWGIAALVILFALGYIFYLTQPVPNLQNLQTVLASNRGSTQASGQTTTTQPTTTLPSTKHPAPPVYASAAYLLDADTGAVIYSKKPSDHLPLFSPTKLMTALVAVEHGNLDQRIRIDAKIQGDFKVWLSSDSSLMGILAGETYTLRELLYGLLLPSGNDAAVAIADAVSGSVPAFVALMNQKAAELQMNDTHFTNPHGLLFPTHYSSARDLALLGKASLSNATIAQISATKDYTLAATSDHHASDLINGNQFLWWYPGVTGGKPGFDGVHNFNQVISVNRHNHHLIGVVLNTVNWWTDMRNLMAYGLDDYTWISPRDLDSTDHPIVYDSQWNYFASDRPDQSQNIIPTDDGGHYYSYTGYTVSGTIQSYFDAHGGLQAFSYPTSTPETNTTSISQHFGHQTISCNSQTRQCHT